MDLYGLIGKKLSHSFSPGYFSQKFRKLKLNAGYKTFELDNISEFPELVNTHPDLKGLNVTIPYKKAVIPFLDELDPVAEKLGAVNTIKIVRKNANLILTGFNTDVVGFEMTLLPLVKNRKNLSALVLGTGGSARAVEFVLNKSGIDFKFVSRSGLALNTILYADLSDEIISKNHLIINTTPLGMFPDTESAPLIPYASLGSSHILYDLIYNPSETVFLKKGKEKGAIVSNGRKMLEMQADASWEIFKD